MHEEDFANGLQLDCRIAELAARRLSSCISKCHVLLRMRLAREIAILVAHTAGSTNLIAVASNILFDIKETYGHSIWAWQLSLIRKPIARIVVLETHIFHSFLREPCILHTM